jgi:hypothetical protein
VNRARLVILVGLVVVVGVLAGPSSANAATWCGSVGTGDRSSVFGGFQIRVWYAVPSDGADASATRAPDISRAVDAIEGWWKTQDAERAPRFTRTLFPCEPQVDLRLLRLPHDGATLRPTDGRFAKVGADVFAAEASPVLTHLVFYDGPVDDTNLCGQGGGNGSSPGLAVVFLASCGDVPIEVIAAHELIHALGALPDSGPPHACPDSTGHPCDSMSDIMYPFASTAAIGSLTLDVGRDDYYGHPGTWLDVQDSPWLTLVNRQVPLTFGFTGVGSIRADTPGGACATAPCTMSWNAESTATVVAEPGPGKRLRRWSGGCAGETSPACTVTLSQPTTLTAEFVEAAFPLSVVVTGKGTVGVGGASCARSCTSSKTSYTAVKLVAHPAKGWKLRSWAGACRGSRPTCVVPMTGPSKAQAVFVRRAAV